MAIRLGRGAILAAIASSALLVSACATETTYRPATGSGFNRQGYSERRVEDNRFLVSFAGNTVTSRDTVERYLLFRAAELTVQSGFDHFILVQRDTDLRSRTYSTPGAFGGNFGPGFGGLYGGWGPSWRYYGRGFGWRSWSPFWGDPWFGNNMDIRTVDRFEATAEIVLGRGPVPAGQVRGFSARSVIDNIGPTVVLPKP